MDSNFRFRVRCKRGLRRKSPLRLHAAVDHLRLPSVAISSGAKRNLGTEPLSRAEPEVRIHLPPAGSPLRTRFGLEGDAFATLLRSQHGLPYAARAAGSPTIDAQVHGYERNHPGRSWGALWSVRRG